MQVYFSVNCSKKGVLIHWNHFSGNVCCRYASVITVTYIVAFNPGIKMACATVVVSFSYTLCPSRGFHSSLICIFPGFALPLYVLTANNFRLLLASKRKKILFIPDFHVLCVRGSLSFL